MEFVNHGPRVALDFDGVLHTYDKGWQNGEIYGDVVEGAREALRELDEGFELVVFTCRQPIEAVHKWIEDKFGLDIEVTNAKPVADIYIDDRGYRFEGDWQQTVSDIWKKWNARWSREAALADYEGEVTANDGSKT